MGKLYVFSGAGLSAESGVSTFRDSGGLWENHKIEDVCDITTWRKNYDLVHDFYNQRRSSLSSIKPNPAHLTIAKWQQEYGEENVVCVTTNVDDLLDRAGVKGTVYLHGEITKMVNTSTGDVWEIGYKEFDTSTDESKVVKPFVVFFGEMAPEYETLRAINCLDMGPSDLAIFIGMSFVVVPVGMCIPFYNSPTTVNVNTDPNTVTSWDWDHHIIETAVNSMDRLDKIVNGFFNK